MAARIGELEVTINQMREIMNKYVAETENIRETNLRMIIEKTDEIDKKAESAAVSLEVLWREHKALLLDSLGGFSYWRALQETQGSIL